MAVWMHEVHFSFFIVLRQRRTLGRAISLRVWWPSTWETAWIFEQSFYLISLCDVNNNANNDANNAVLSINYVNDVKTNYVSKL